ncbi:MULTISPECIES: hypothetical protein [Phyllobacteriaceae]|jgi:hypothetical protein|uniref:Uncharacterized protein n=1 Tax=Mesorhizobium hungaricum TaxID=1566387 RepID=A0A1C2DS15_9HYPH|nr:MULTISPECIES: hypothetical protein [Mesorhizobium]MBN9236100.1 hypothetical protein [Mesorhizobium sp.]MDQ0328060.1 hypothetical protein [Mesorhizobium sp. YL-MeA3-2017]OCX17544.1 hypothetical protein QV13_12350 [Mesorhizobium hungaricum]
MPPALKLTVAKAELLYRGRDHFWRVIRALGADGRRFTAAEVRGACDEPQRGTIPTLLRRLQRDGFVEACGERRSAAGKLEKEWRLIKAPKAAPTVSRDGRRRRPSTAQQQMWNVMRGPLARAGFSFADLVAYGSTDDLTVPAVTARSYIGALSKAGYLLRLDPGGPGRPALWRLRPSMNSGPLPPMVLRAKLVFDQNRHRVAGEVLAEEVAP